jgi:DNA repair protein RadC
MKTLPLSASIEDSPPEDLLAAVLQPQGTPAESRACARQLLVAAGGLPRLARMSPRELLRELALPPVEEVKPASGRAAGAASTTGRAAGAAERAALRLASAFELGRRAARVELAAGQAVRGMADIEPHLRGLLDGRLKELFLVVLLDAKNRPLRTERVSEGCLTWSVVHPREVYAPAVRESAGAVIVAHNHPSGDPTPSAQDIEVTARLAKVGELLGIPLLDHIVVGRQRCVSMRAQGLMGSLTVPA